MATFALPDALAQRIEQEARRLNVSTEERIVRILEDVVAPQESFEPGVLTGGLSQLRSCLDRIPCVTWTSISGTSEPNWWVKFKIDLGSPIAWHVVQSLGFVLNYLSTQERLPTVFMPVSPPPYLNGGPHEFLSWVIESTLPFVDAGQIAAVLESRLPQPCNNEEAWLADE